MFPSDTAIPIANNFIAENILSQNKPGFAPSYLKNNHLSVSLACLLLLLIPSTNGYAQLNKCSINGKIVYTDQICPGNSAKKLNLNKLNISAAKANSKGSKTKYKSSEWFRDYRGYAQALKISTEQNVPIFIYAYTDWCNYCKKLHKDIFDDSQVKNAMSEFVKVKLNPEHSALDQKLFKQWGGTGFPTLLVQTSYLSPPTRTSDPFTKVDGKWVLIKKNAFIGMLKNSQ